MKEFFMDSRVVSNVAQSCENLGQVELEGIKLESADIQLLDVSQMTLDQHVAIQPAAIAYYGALLKETQRRLAAHDRLCKRLELKRYAQAREAVMSGAVKGNKPTVKDIEARALLDNEKAIEREEQELQKLKFEVDTLDSWYEAWRQKSFSIRENINLSDDERWSSSSAGDLKEGKEGKEGKGGKEGKEEKERAFRDRVGRVRDIIRQGKRESC